MAATIRTSTWRGRPEPDALELAVLEDAQELHLDVGGELADLVQEQRAPVGQLEAADLRPGRPGEGALLVAEQLALDEGRRQGRAVDLDEGPVPARAPVVDGVGQQLLAGARLAEEQHRAGRGRHLGDLREDLEDGRALADDRVEPLLTPDLGAEVDRFRFQLGS